jgi:hypothetical protein
MSTRTAYLLTVSLDSERCRWSTKILESIGFKVRPIPCIPNKDKILSNRLSNEFIYEEILKTGEAWSYVFEDDINLVEPLSISELTEYERISEIFFFLGMCEYGPPAKKTTRRIQGKFVYKKAGNVRGLHAIAVSQKGAKILLDTSRSSKLIYMDEVVEYVSKKYPANIVRYDLKSPALSSHRGILYQDRDRFPSTISPL